jgi:CubicO group peptidase (beta-lactamase class C family)
MTSDQLTPEQKKGTEIFFGDYAGWGFGMAVLTRRYDLFAPGRFGWDGGLGTSAHTDPEEGLIGILMTQRLWENPKTPPVVQDFWTSAYQAIED